MKQVYEKIRLYEKIECSYTMSPQDVISIFKSNWDEDNGMEILFSMEKSRYKYSIRDNVLTVKERMKFEDSNTRKTYLKGVLLENGNETMLKFRIYIKPFEFLSLTITTFVILALVIYGFSVADGSTKLLLYGLLIIVPVGYGQTVYNWNNTLKKMKYEFERELKFILESKVFKQGLK